MFCVVVICVCYAHCGWSEMNVYVALCNPIHYSIITNFCTTIFSCSCFLYTILFLLHWVKSIIDVKNVTINKKPAQIDFFHPKCTLYTFICVIDFKNPNGKLPNSNRYIFLFYFVWRWSIVIRSEKPISQKQVFICFYGIEESVRKFKRDKSLRAGWTPSYSHDYISFYWSNNLIKNFQWKFKKHETLNGGAHRTLFFITH